MARIFPDFQTFLDTRDGDIIGITKVTLLSSTSDHFGVPVATDARILSGVGPGESLPRFYLAGKVQVAIDGGTAGNKYTVVTRHRTMVNFGRET